MTDAIQTRTEQHYDVRVFEGPDAALLARVFAAMATEQAGIEFAVESGDYTHDVDMHDWPDGLAFGPWFDRLMLMFKVEVHS